MMIMINNILVPPLLHANTGSITLTGELVQAAHCHHCLHGLHGVGVADVLLKAPCLGSCSHGEDGGGRHPRDQPVLRGQHPRLQALIVPHIAVDESFIVGKTHLLIPHESIEHVHLGVGTQPSQSGSWWQNKAAQ